MSVTIELGEKYAYTLVSGRVVEIVVFGSRSTETGTTEWDLEVDGVRGAYSSIDQALGSEPFVKIERLT